MMQDGGSGERKCAPEQRNYILYYLTKALREMNQARIVLFSKIF